jgi:hypothetical protein
MDGSPQQQPARRLRRELPQSQPLRVSNDESVHPGAVNQLDGVGDDLQLGQTGAHSWLVASSFSKT